MSDDDLLDFESSRWLGGNKYQILTNVLERVFEQVKQLVSLDRIERYKIIVTFFQELNGLDIDKLPISSKLRDKIFELRSEYLVFFEELRKHVDSNSAGALIFDSGIDVDFPDGSFSIFRYSQWTIKKIFFTKEEFFEIHTLVRARTLILDEKLIA